MIFTRKPGVRGFEELERKRRSTWILSGLVLLSLGVGFYVTMVPGTDLARVTPLFGTLPVLRLGLLVLVSLLCAYIIKGEVENGKLLRELWEKKTNIEALNQRVLELSVLHDVSAAINSMLDMSKTADLVMDSAFKLMSADVGVVLLAEDDKEQSTYRVLIGRGLSPDAPRMVEVPAGRGVVSDALATAEMCLCSTGEADPVLVKLLGAERKLASVVAAPLKHRNRVVGVFCLGNETWNQSFDKNDIALLGIFADQVAIALENTRLFENLEASLEELKQTQAKMIQAGKMAAVGQLAAGVAHELNNPIVGILGYSQYALEKIRGRDVAHLSNTDIEKHTRYLGYIERESQRCKAIIQNLLNFSRANSVQMQMVDIHQIIEETFTFTEHPLRINNVQVIKKLEESLPPVRGNQTQLQQVFTNMIINAQKAMEGEGTLTVRCWHEAQGGGDGRGVVRVSFQDTGCGIPPENMGKIFDPFFTTRKVGEGTGLGLSLSHGIIKNHGGEVSVRSEVDKGTTFTITLPVSSNSEPKRTEELTAAAV